jgi:Domain of unknown function (DUF4371)/hAT family C-terminal dimerisation region
MAKRQRTMRDMLFKAGAGRELVDMHTCTVGSSSSTKTPNNEMNAIEKANEDWKDAWYNLFEWVDFNRELGRIFCKICKEGGGKFAYANEGSTNVKISALQDHAKTVEHRKLAWAKHGGQKALQKVVAHANRTCDESLMSLFKAAYFMGKETVPFHKFPSLCNLLVSCNAPMTEKLYHDEKACADMIFAISSVIQRQILDRVRDSKFFGLMIDESTDISVKGHLVVFATFLEGGLPLTCFLGLLFIVDGKKDSKVIFDTLMAAMKIWGLDLSKCVGFGSDGAATMVGKNTGVAALLKKVNPFLTSTHCVAHRTNLAALEASKSESCKGISADVDSVVNALAGHFKKSSKRKAALQALQNELNDAQKNLRRYHKIRWLSRWQAISTLCDSLESVLVYMRDIPRSKDDGSAPFLYAKLREFKFIYILYFLADILQMLAKLSKNFQNKLVDISCIGSIVKTEIATIRMCFLIDTCDLNQDTFNPSTGFHIIPEFGPPSGYLRRLSSEIRGAKFHTIDMIRDPSGVDLEAALFFQKMYAEAVCMALEARFVDNDVIDAFKILNPIHMPQRQVGLSSWGVVQLDLLLKQYGQEKRVGGTILPPLVDAVACKQEFFAFKLQGTTEWIERTFGDLWASIAWSASLKLKYPNLLTLAEIARCQCVSTATCERAFSVQNGIKQKFRNRMTTSNLDSVMRVAMEGSAKDFDLVLVDAITLWKNARKFRYLFTNPEKYLTGGVEDSFEEGENSEP